MRSDKHGFCYGFTSYSQKYDSICVIVDKVNKLTHFLAVKTINSVEDFSRLKISEILRLHGVPFSLSSQIGGPPFTSDFWKSFQKGLVNEVNLSTIF